MVRSNSPDSDSQVASDLQQIYSLLVTLKDYIRQKHLTEAIGYAKKYPNLIQQSLEIRTVYQAILDTLHSKTPKPHNELDTIIEAELQNFIRRNSLEMLLAIIGSSIIGKIWKSITKFIVFLWERMTKFYLTIILVLLLAIIGAFIGAVIGSAIGGEDGTNFGARLGAILGSMLAINLSAT